MALTQTYAAFNVVGNKREDYIVATFTGVTSGIVKTRLKWIDAIDIEDTTGTDVTYSTYPNSDTAATDDPTDAGHIFMTGVSSGQVYTIRAIGR